MLQFRGDAIELSGLTGTKIKSQLLGLYYPLWWSITSGGERAGHRFRTSIIDLNAATGENFIKETQEVILGSSGHALQLKMETPKTKALIVVLIEEDAECFARLKNVMRRRWPGNDWENPRSFGVYPCHAHLKAAVAFLERNRDQLGNSLILFDPLLYTSWKTIESVAESRIRTFYETGTEFIIFLFTSDWVKGRGDFLPLPDSADSSKWNDAEKVSVEEADNLFGGEDWRIKILNEFDTSRRSDLIAATYREKLFKWFRYVLPLPFAPKNDQIYHLFFCSNYEAGIRITRDFYSKMTANPVYSPDNRIAFQNFKTNHPQLSYKGSSRPFEWKILWKVIREHEGGICDVNCADLIEVEPDSNLRSTALEWLAGSSYLNQLPMQAAWEKIQRIYSLNWDSVEKSLGILRPQPLRALRPSDVVNMNTEQ